MRRQRAEGLLASNQAKQDARVNTNRKAPRSFTVNDLVFVIKSSQSTDKLDSGMRGPYRIIRTLSNNRYELQLIAGSYGKTTQAAAEYMMPWNGEWTPETCSAFFDCVEDPIVEAVPELRQEPQPGPSRCAPHPGHRPAEESSEDAAPSGEAVLAASPTHMATPTTEAI
ncbi:uncharacterized protein LOC126372815 [Pectinophora gossypiella]|uniref:uncharacterized protein LOC126372815 n=1 Tax=Pectinophora gossypiella TaxID=13191 RepID=UPI00214E51E8|nr:uncharacterized protein LOC126372815 [Pectinophora gossypiella]